MKKVLSLVLALAMVLGCFASVFAAEYTDVKADADYATAVSVLSDLGVVSGYTDGTYKPENVVTRAEMAALIVKALGLTPAASATTAFSDVPASHWASGYIAYANSLGIIAGYTDGTFKPAKTVSYDEALTMIISALGYTADSLEGNTWPAAYVMKAQMLGITEDVTVLGSVGANRGDIAQMLYNTLGQAIGKTNKDGEFVANNLGTVATPKDDTMFVRLGATKEFKGVVTPAVAAKALIDIDEYLGAYVSGLMTDKEKIVAINDVDTEFVETTLAKLKAKDFTTDYNGGEEVILIKNGEDSKTTLGALADGTYNFAVVNKGSYIKSVKSATIWDGEDDFIMTKAMVTELAKKDTLNGKAFEMTTTKKIDTDEFVLAGVDSLDEIKAGDVVTLYLKSNGKIAKVEVSDKVVTGKITAKTSSKVTIDGTAYTMAGAELDADGNKTGKTKFADTGFSTEYKVYFNYAGDIAFYGPVDAAEVETLYGVVLDYALTTGKDGEWSSESATLADTTRKVKLFTAEGKEEVLTVCGDLTADESAFAYVADFKDMTTNHPEKDVLYTYSVNEDGEIIKLAKATDLTKTATATEVSAKATVEGVYFASDAKVFVQTTVSSGKYSYAIKDAAALASTKITGKYSIGTKGTITVMFLTTTSSENATYGFFTGDYVQNGTDKYTLTFVVDGAETKYAASTDGTGFAKLVYAKITVTSDKVSAVAAVGLAADADHFTTTDRGLKVATSGSISGNTYNDGSKFYAIDASAEVYVIEDGEVSVGAIADLEDEDNKSITVYQMSDAANSAKVYDVVVIVK